jgi:uncharacterized protein YpmS
MTKPQMRLLITLLALALSALACNLPSMSATPPPTAVPIPEEDLQNLEEKLRETLTNPGQSGEVTLTITQEQINAFVQSEMQNQPDQPFSDPQVVLTNGQMEIIGKANRAGFTVDARVVMTPRIDASGNPKMDVTSVFLGPIEAPEAVRSQVASMVDDTLSRYLASNADGFQATRISIGEGQMTITGRPKQS